MQVSPVKKPGAPLGGNKRNEMYITVACECGKVFVNELDYQVRIFQNRFYLENKTYYPLKTINTFF